MSPQDSLELLYAVLRNNRAYEQINGYSFLSDEEYRKLFEVVIALESRYSTVPQIYARQALDRSR
jgi:hypothetical protein